MLSKETFVSYVNENFIGKTKEILLSQINLFYDDVQEIEKNKYNVNDAVKLKQGTFLHGIPGELENFDFTIEHGFISTDFTVNKNINKIKNSVGFWNIQSNTLLADYINKYSGFTISYLIGRGPEAKTISKLVPFHKFDEITEQLNNDENVWSYSGEQTKEVRFIPSLVSNKRQIAFILNMESAYAKKLAYNDVWNLDFDEEILTQFLDYRYKEKFINNDRKNRNAITTDRESAIMFGLPISLVEGVLIGRKLEANQKVLEHIKSKLPNCYICNLDGKVIVGNN